MSKKQKKLRRVDDIHKPRPFIRFRFRVVIFFFIVCILACLVYYMIRANADISYVITGRVPVLPDMLSEFQQL